MAEGRAGSCRTLNVFLKYPSWAAKRTSHKRLEDAELRKDIKEHCLRLFSSLLRCQGEGVSEVKSDTSCGYTSRVLSTYLAPILVRVSPLGQRPAPSVLPALRLALVDSGKGRRAVSSQILVHVPGLPKVRGALDQHPGGHAALRGRRQGEA